MPLHDPVAVYNAATNIEAHVVRTALLNAGIEAHVTEDVSQVGTWMLGLLPEIHRPQVWVDREHIDRARPVLVEYDRARAVQAGALSLQAIDAPPIDVLCEDCGQRTLFGAALRGSIQRCPHCGAYVDVGQDDFWEQWQGADDAEDETESKQDSP